MDSMQAVIPPVFSFALMVKWEERFKYWRMNRWKED